VKSRISIGQNPKGQTPETIEAPHAPSTADNAAKFLPGFLNKVKNPPSNQASLKKTRHPMKAIVTTLAITALTLLGAAPQAEARQHHSSRIYISGYLPCGAPIYKERYFVGYDRCGNAIWGTRVVRRENRPVARTCYTEPYYPPTRCYSGGRNSITIQASFGR
jgi:hypothetical protein